MHEWSFKSVSVRSKDHVRSLHQHVEIVAGTTDAKVFAVAFLVVNFAEVTLSILLNGELLGELPLLNHTLRSSGSERGERRRILLLKLKFSAPACGGFG